jgi:heme A synthase
MVGTLVVQVVLGGLVVLTGIPPWLIALHEGGALLLLDVAVATALWLTLGSAAGSAASPPRIRVALWALAAWAGLTSMLGSYLAHLGLACTGFASCVATMAHADGRFGAGIWHWLAALVLVAGLIAVLAGLDRSPAPVRRWSSRRTGDRCRSASGPGAPPSRPGPPAGWPDRCTTWWRAAGRPGWPVPCPTRTAPPSTPA